MLFNSLPFLMFFLPVALLCFYGLGKNNGALGKISLAVLSFVFYAYWDYRYLPLLAGSIFINYCIGVRISEHVTNQKSALSRNYLIGGIIFNLALLGFFKYANLLVTSMNIWLIKPIDIPHIILPIGISFFTFTQIAFLVDAFHGKAKEYKFWDYALFVSYFPHQIAGPILHHGEMMSQFRPMNRIRWSTDLFAIGLSILALGLVKKILIADTLADIANPIFSAADGKGIIEFAEAWVGALAFSLQLYFDFSAYCDMAIGISLMFGIRLPANFNSPYKASSIIDFWQRWHITLSRFLRDYLYIPLGGNRMGPHRRYLNLMITMGLGGLWHGASWTFLFWGVLHGSYLVVNHGWRQYVGNAFKPVGVIALVWECFCWGLTFFCVLIAWIFFRAETFQGAFHLLGTMFGSNGVAIHPALSSHLGWVPGLIFRTQWLGAAGGVATIIFLLVLLLICIRMPNVQEIFAKQQPVLADKKISINPSQFDFISKRLEWRPSVAWAIFLSTAVGIAISRLGNDSQFLYFNF